MNASKGLLLLFVSLAAIGVQAQNGKNVNRSRHHYASPKVRGEKARSICPVFTNSKYPFQGLGIKVGDPFAITYKYYPGKHLAFAIDAGKAASGLYNHYFREKFNGYVNSDTMTAGQPSLVYLTHRVKSDFIGEFKVLYRLDARKVSEGLQGYAGLGWEWKRTTLRYDYVDSRANGSSEDPFGSFERTRVTMGPQFVLGIEYTYFRIPISAFMEVEYFSDVQADPGWRRFEGGVGLRYLF
ncbi:MAG TPA: hypothetical protein VF490_19415 [Chryseosolibacter sp.]